MSVVSKAFVSTASGDKYVQQLIKHWSHRFETSYADGEGLVPFSDVASASFTSDPEGIRIVLRPSGAEEAETLRGVIESHLDRFAFREAPLSYTWEDGR